MLTRVHISWKGVMYYGTYYNSGMSPFTVRLGIESLMRKELEFLEKNNPQAKITHA